MPLEHRVVYWFGASSDAIPTPREKAFAPPAPLISSEIAMPDTSASNATAVVILIAYLGNTLPLFDSLILTIIGKMALHTHSQARR